MLAFKVQHPFIVSMVWSHKVGLIILLPNVTLPMFIIIFYYNPHPPCFTFILMLVQSLNLNMS